MPSLVWFPFYYKDFMTSQKVLVMSHSQRSAYVWLLCRAWDDQDCGVPASSQKLKEAANWTAKDGDFRRVRACFQPHPTVKGKLYNPRLYEEWMKAKQKSAAARASVLTRWQKPSEPQPARPHRPITDRSGSGFESVGKIADKVFPPK